MQPRLPTRMPAITAVETGARPLTPGEVALIASVFGAAIDPAPVRIRRAKFWLFHPWWVTMAPDGDIWCHPNGFNWRTDYAAGTLGMQAHFIHEMVHVWQVQTGGSLVTRRLPFARYRYRLIPGRAFGAYGLEQQACIVADAFLLGQGRTATHCTTDAPPLATYRALLPFVC